MYVLFAGVVLLTGLPMVNTLIAGVYAELHPEKDVYESNQKDVDDWEQQELYNNIHYYVCLFTYLYDAEQQCWNKVADRVVPMPPCD